ncbi:MAG: radical SAM protein [Oscillospiraceae bacterium]
MCASASARSNRGRSTKHSALPCALAGFPNLCPQFHLSLQSGSDSVLRRMNRKYDTARYDESVHLLHAYFPGCAVTTDLIVGFPGETDEEFGNRWALSAPAASKIHIFVLAPRRHARRENVGSVRTQSRSSARRRRPPWPVNWRMRSIPR